MLAIIFICVATATLGSGRIVAKPKHTAVMAGSLAIIECRTSSANVTWEFLAPYPANITTVVRDGVLVANTSHYRINNSTPGQFDLVIESVTLNDGGIYSCKDAPNSYRSASYAALVVVSSLKCKMRIANSSYSSSSSSDGLVVVVEGEQLALYCSVDYGGHLVAQMFWADAAHRLYFDDLTTYEYDERQIVLHYGLTSYTTAKAVVGDGNVVDEYFCYVFFSRMNVRFNSNESLQSGFICATPNITVVYPVRNVAVRSIANGSIHTVGSVLTCQADGNPTVGYEWTDSEGSVLSSTSELTLSVEGKHDYRCTASNVIRNVTHRQTIHVTVDVIRFNSMEDVYFWLFVWLAVCQCVAILFLVWRRFVKRKRYQFSPLSNRDSTMSMERAVG